MTTNQVTTESQPRMRPVQVGLWLPTWEGSLGGATPRWADVLALARRAEALGVDALWIADHLLFPRADLLAHFRVPGVENLDIAREEPLGTWECWSLLAALAAAVPRVALGTLVTCAGYRNPALLAKMAATVDEISGGRLVLGLGAGDSPFEHRAFGYATDHWAGRFEEALTIIRALLRDGSCDFAGTYHEVHECRLRPAGPRAGGPPILIAAQGTGRRMLRLTAQHADQWNAFLVYTRSLPDALPPLQAIVEAACAAHGRDPATLARTAAVRVALLGEQVPVGTPITGSAEAIADALRSFARAGAAAVQVLLTPNTLAGLEAFAPVLEHLDRG